MGIEWFHSNRPEGCSSAAIDHAAANGHLELAQWLLANRSEECTERAMDGAASEGNLDMVKWRHTNVNVGCTTAAMDRAAWNGHLGMLKWLHVNRSEGCTAKALESAIGRGHLQVAHWLQLRYPEYSPAEVNITPGVVNTFEIFLFLHTNYAQLFTRSFVQNMLSARMRRHLDLSSEEITAWMQEHYPKETATQTE